MKKIRKTVRQLYVCPTIDVVRVASEGSLLAKQKAIFLPIVLLFVLVAVVLVVRYLELFRSSHWIQTIITQMTRLKDDEYKSLRN